MIYYYIVRVEYKKNNLRIIKDYTGDFCSIVQLFIYLENKHKGNYTILFIKPINKFHKL